MNQENSYVKDTLIKWAKDLQNNYQIDGFRIDTVPEVPKWFWTELNKNLDIYTIGECFDGRVDYVAGYQKSIPGMLNYPLYFEI